jgi:two-component system, LuxR family, response regulator FixJ
MPPHTYACDYVVLPALEGAAMSEQIGGGTELFVVDDDDAMRDTLSVVFSHEGYQVTSFAEGSAFLAAARVRTPACVLLDVNMPGRSGINILKDLDAQHYDAPIFIISAQRDIPLAVDAIKNGAFDFIEKPFVPDAVTARVRAAVAGWKHPAANGANGGSHSPRFPGHELLTPREREVLAHIAGGASNKESGRLLNISPRTIEVHRARIMEKLKAKNAADLVRIVLSSSLGA